MERFTFFYSKTDPFSQFYPCHFEVEGIRYNCAEQYMMHQKALMFGDVAMAEAIMSTEVPLEQKRFGRKVTPFDPVRWGQACIQIVAKGNYAKFTQNPAFLEKLLATKGTTLVEASPRDRVWGIGMGAKNPLAQDRKNWRGRNQLGEVLTRVREQILGEHKQN